MAELDTPDKIEFLGMFQSAPRRSRAGGTRPWNLADWPRPGGL